MDEIDGELISRMINGEIVYDERDLHKFWYEKNPLGYGKKLSFDEFILTTLVKRTFPEAMITQQELIKPHRYKMDLSVKVTGAKKYIEFEGPSHFAVGRFGPPNPDPFKKKNIVETKTNCEVINWPYWIQRCEANVRVAITGNGTGYGVLWSTTTHFGDFVFENSADVILKMSRRFNVPETDGFGHFYGPNTFDRNNPEHPIVQRILDGKENLGRLIPKGTKDKEFWLPQKLRHLL